jgi:hypothetical protein
MTKILRSSAQAVSQHNSKKPGAHSGDPGGPEEWALRVAISGFPKG